MSHVRRGHRGTPLSVANLAEHANSASHGSSTCRLQIDPQSSRLPSCSRSGSCRDLIVAYCPDGVVCHVFAEAIEELLGQWRTAPLEETPLVAYKKWNLQTRTNDVRPYSDVIVCGALRVAAKCKHTNKIVTDFEYSAWHTPAY